MVLYLYRRGGDDLEILNRAFGLPEHVEFMRFQERMFGFTEDIPNHVLATLWMLHRYVR